MIMFIHRFNNHVMNQKLHFHPAVMHNKALNRVVHDQHHWQNQNTDDLKHAGFEFKSAATNHLDEWLNRHHDSNQPAQLKKALRTAQKSNPRALHSTCGGHALKRKWLTDNRTPTAPPDPLRHQIWGLRKGTHQTYW
tara:strand:- start:115 stop:525 length:411 start_codon:yes stop_codon:yes gene_type:complete